MDNQTASVTASGIAWHPIGTLYARRALDPVIDLAATIASDVMNRPTQYRLPDEVADTLSGFAVSLGRMPNWPDAQQRRSLSGRVLDGLAVATAGLRKAAIVFVERGSGPTEPRLRRAAQEAAEALRASCRQVEGTAVTIAERQLRAAFEHAATVLTSQEVTSAFGVPPLSAGESQDQSDLAPFLGSEVRLLHNAVGRSVMQPQVRNPLDEHKLVTIQRVARHGADAISLALDLDGDDGLDAAMEAAYGWARALQDLLVGIDVVRAWVDPRYLLSLHVAERDVLPSNPVGEIELDSPALQVRADAQVQSLRGTGTLTIEWEICCSTAGCSTNATCMSTGTCCHLA